MGIEEILQGHGPMPERPPYPVPPGVDVHPGLMPAQWFADQVQVGPHLAVMVCVATPAGLSYSFWPEESAVGFGKEVERLGNLTKAGLYLPQRQNGKAPHPHPHPPQS